MIFYKPQYYYADPLHPTQNKELIFRKWLSTRLKTRCHPGMMPASSFVRYLEPTIKFRVSNQNVVLPIYQKYYSLLPI